MRLAKWVLLLLSLSGYAPGQYIWQLGEARVQQFPLDKIPTQGKWIAVGGIAHAATAVTEPGDCQRASGGLVPIRPSSTGAGGVDAVTSGYAVCGPTIRGMAAYIGRTGFSSNQYAKAKLPQNISGLGGVAINCSTDGTTKSGYLLLATAGSGTGNDEVRFGKFVNGSWTDIALNSATTIPTGSTIELRRLGNQIQALINGSPPEGFSGAYTDTSLSGGAPGMAGENGGATSDWSAGNVGDADATSAATYIPTYPDYDDGGAFANGSWSIGWPWFQASLGGSSGRVWGNDTGEVLISGSNYALGQTLYNSSYNEYGAGSGQVVYRAGEFGADQWQEVVIKHNPDDNKLNNWFLPLRQMTWVPGFADGGCEYADTYIPGTFDHCFDTLSIYPGVQTMNSATSALGSRALACGAGAKAEYSCTPFFHVTSVRGEPSSTDTSDPNYCGPVSQPYGCNKVITVAGGGSGTQGEGLHYAPHIGDKIHVEFVGNIFRAYCWGNSANYNFWQPNHAYTAGTYVIDSNGAWQLATNSGTSGGSAPSWANSWDNTTTYYGNTTTDNTQQWMWYGTPCPTNTTWDMIVNVTDPHFVTNVVHPQPSLWMGGRSLNDHQSAPALPYFTNWKAGTVKNGGLCTILPGGCGSAQPLVNIISELEWRSRGGEISTIRRP